MKHWVRNLERDVEGAFWLPASYGKFFPDFICELEDGRILVVEYKGEHLRNVPMEIESKKTESAAYGPKRAAANAYFLWHSRRTATAGTFAVNLT